MSDDVIVEPDEETIVTLLVRRAAMDGIEPSDLGGEVKGLKIPDAVAFKAFRDLAYSVLGLNDVKVRAAVRRGLRDFYDEWEDETDDGR